MLSEDLVLSKEYLEDIKPGENEAVLQEVKALSKRINGRPKDIVKFYFEVKGETITEECVKYVKGDSKLRRFLEGMTGMDIEELLTEDFNIKDLTNRRYIVQIQKNKSQRTGKVFNNIVEIKGEVKDKTAGKLTTPRVRNKPTNDLNKKEIKELFNKH